MSISSISFWQQDQNWLQGQQAWDQQLSGSNAASAAMTSALTTKSSGIASIFNQEALTRVTNELQSAANAALQSEKGGSSSSASGNASQPTAAPVGALGLVPAAPSLASAGTAESVLSTAISGGSTNALANMLNGVNMLV